MLRVILVGIAASIVLTLAVNLFVFDAGAAFKLLHVVLLLVLWLAIVIFVAGLATINRELYDAAAVDGASRWQQLVHVTVPGLASAITIVMTLGLIRGFRVFTEIYATTGGGPGGATEVVMTQIYKMGFTQFDYGYASAASFLLFAFTATMSTVYLWWRKRREA